MESQRQRKKVGRRRKFVKKCEDVIQKECNEVKSDLTEQEKNENSSTKLENQNVLQNSEKPLDSIDKEKNKQTNQSHYRVSRSGRVIKPRKNDDYFVYIKKELIDDIENEPRNPDVGENTSEAIDDEDADPTYGDKSSSPTMVEKKYNCICELCGFITENLSVYNAHHREHLHAEKKCSICGWICDDPNVTKEDFQAHLDSHSGPQPYSCSFCPMKFTSKTNLHQHLPKHSDIKPFICSVCSASFKWKHALKSHMITHNASKKYLCDSCGFATAHKASLKSHSLIHTGETFKCQEEGCSYQTVKKTNLQLHLMTHTREKPHQCPVCGTCFSLLKNMKRHMLLHNNERRYKCEICFFTSTRYDKLKEHYLKQHNLGTKPKKKLRLSDYINTEKEIAEDQNELCEQQNIEEEPVIHLGNDMETIQLEVVESTDAVGSTQIVSVTNSTGETIPIAITQQGKATMYEIPVVGNQDSSDITYAIPMNLCEIVTTDGILQDPVTVTEDCSNE